MHGANLAQQALEDGVLDELQIHLTPVLLGDSGDQYAGGDSPPLPRRTLSRTRYTIADHPLV